MKYVRLGNTNLEVSELSLGTMIFGETGPRGADEDSSQKMIKHFVDVGGNFIDTANVYAGGTSEKILGKTISEYRNNLVIATKCRFPLEKGVNNSGLSRKYILHAIEGSLKRLQTNYIDLFYVHCNVVNMSFIDFLKTLNDLVTSNKVHYIGVSNFRAWEVMKALQISESKDWARFEAAQYQYSLVERSIEREFSSLAVSEKISIIPWGPLGGGFLTGKYKSDQKPTEGRISVTPESYEESWSKRSTDRNWEVLAKMEEIKQKSGKSISQIAIAWLLKQPGVVSPIIGVRTMDQLQDNLGVVDWELSNEDVDELTRLSNPDLPYPYRMIKSNCC